MILTPRKWTELDGKQAYEAVMGMTHPLPDCGDVLPDGSTFGDMLALAGEYANGDDICGLCGLPGADKMPHPIHWPDERVPETEFVHAECEAAECVRASALCQGRARDCFLDYC